MKFNYLFFAVVVMVVFGISPSSNADGDDDDYQYYFDPDVTPKQRRIETKKLDSNRSKARGKSRAVSPIINDEERLPTYEESIAEHPVPKEFQEQGRPNTAGRSTSKNTGSTRAATGSWVQEGNDNKLPLTEPRQDQLKSKGVSSDSASRGSRFSRKNTAILPVNEEASPSRNLEIRSFDNMDQVADEYEKNHRGWSHATDSDGTLTSEPVPGADPSKVVARPGAARMAKAVKGSGGDMTVVSAWEDPSHAFEKTKAMGIDGIRGSGNGKITTEKVMGRVVEVYRDGDYYAVRDPNSKTWDLKGFAIHLKLKEMKPEDKIKNKNWNKVVVTEDNLNSLKKIQRDIKDYNLLSDAEISLMHVKPVPKVRVKDFPEALKEYEKGNIPYWVNRHGDNATIRNGKKVVTDEGLPPEQNDRKPTRPTTAKPDMRSTVSDFSGIPKGRPVTRAQNSEEAMKRYNEGGERPVWTSKTTGKEVTIMGGKVVEVPQKQIPASNSRGQTGNSNIPERPTNSNRRANASNSHRQTKPAAEARSTYVTPSAPSHPLGKSSLSDRPF